MKKLLVLLTLVAAVSAYSQGTVNFLNKGITWSGGLKNSKIRYAAGGPVTASTAVDGGTAGIVAGGVTWGSNAKAALYFGSVGADPSTFVMVAPAVGFKTGTTDAGYWDDSDASRTIPGHLNATDVLVQARVWDTGSACASYEAAVAATTVGRYVGASTVMRVTLGGGDPPTSPAEMVDNVSGTPMAAFTLNYMAPVPEPSVIGLGLLGAVAGLFVFRRRN